MNYYRKNYLIKNAIQYNEGDVIMDNTNLLETSSYIWDLPNYFQVKTNKKLESKLIHIMMKGFNISTNPYFNKIKLTEDEEELCEEYLGMLHYLLKLKPSKKNIEFLNNLLNEYFDFILKKIEFTNKLIDKTEYNKYKHKYSNILNKQGEFFEKHILIDNYEESSYFKGYKEEIVSDLIETKPEDYVSIDIKHILK